MYACTMQLKNLLQICENVLDVSRRQDGLFGELLVENVVQNSKHPDVCTLCVKQLCRHKRKMLTQDGRQFMAQHDLHLTAACWCCISYHYLTQQCF